MTVARGFGLAGALDRGIAAKLAIAAQAAGYRTFWANDTPNGDGLALLTAVAEQADAIDLGVGVIPIDRVPAAQIAARVNELGLPQNRLIVGIGSGGLKQGARAAVEAAARELREHIDARVVVGALGPRMCEIGGQAADGVLLNWLTPSYLPDLADLTRRAAERAGRPKPWIGAYVRVALTGPGLERLREESNRYASFPQYAAHFERMGVQAIETSVSGEPVDLQRGLAAFPADADEIVVRAVAAAESLEDYLALLHAAAPVGERNR